ncbi:hypothetical protein PFISCL1PPCAC_26447, partial [Pristionchus fissidentatus]
ISTQSLFLISKLIFATGYILCYPWPMYSKPLRSFNESTHTGCNPDEYKWCSTQEGTPFAIFTGVMIIVMGLAIPCSALSLDTIYSKILGNIDQNLMQAVFGAAENLMMVLGPIYATQIFTAFGMSILCLVNASVYLLAAFVWIGAWKPVRPYR